MALDLAGVAIERDGRGRIQIVTRPLIAEPWRGVAGAPIDDIGIRIVIAGHPGRGAAGLPGIGLLPGVAAGLAGRRNGIGLPGRLAGIAIERLHEAAHAELTAGHADQHLALHDEGRHGHVIAGLPVLDRSLPGHLAGLGVESDERGVESGEENLVAIERNAAAGIMQCAEPLRDLALEPPEKIAGRRVESDDLIVRRGDEHHAIIDDRRGLVTGVHARGEAPHGHERFDVADIDLVERAIAPALIATADHEPVLRLGVGEACVCNRRVVRAERRSCRSGHQDGRKG